jgi:hypothetical protein
MAAGTAVTRLIFGITFRDYPGYSAHQNTAAKAANTASGGAHVIRKLSITRSPFLRFVGLAASNVVGVEQKQPNQQP